VKRLNLTGRRRSGFRNKLSTSGAEPEYLHFSRTAESLNFFPLSFPQAGSSRSGKTPLGRWEGGEPAARQMRAWTLPTGDPAAEGSRPCLGGREELHCCRRARRGGGARAGLCARHGRGAGGVSGGRGHPEGPRRVRVPAASGTAESRDLAWPRQLMSRNSFVLRAEEGW